MPPPQFDEAMMDDILARDAARDSVHDGYDDFEGVNAGYNGEKDD
jgi:hypothetical protein